MVRFLIVSGYFELMMFLQVTNRLDQYINTHYRYLTYLTMGLSLLMALVQLKTWSSADKVSEHSDHGLTKKHQRVISYVLLSLPLIIGMFFPTISLDTTIVEAKGFSFPVSQESIGDPEMNTQYLKPDTSIYYNQTDYAHQMDQLMEKYQKDQVLTITDENYLEVMELIYTYPNTFVGKKVIYEGFVYETINDQQTYDFLFRFGIIHCVADSGVFGLQVKLPEPSRNNQWLRVEGTIETEYFTPFHRMLPTVEVENVQKIAAPKNQYVYRSF
ncbi:phosphate ABC transporter substrate-binding protein [Enterococcus florum]|uniref:Phosphate ABC transporter substrate-binding protein n=1 Tax=Enterococcus florum TaxID=2480627 RepID=A0A4P5PFI0_9ENTE|nr:TIGR03943 family protein [Enterococcus florum]GCF95514.1 phosphate ABC transporter substrate-binding protein [Enterococcus florum]